MPLHMNYRLFSIKTEPDLLQRKTLEKYGYFSKEGIAVVDIEPGGEGQVLYEGIYWQGRYVSGKKKIPNGQKVCVEGRENINLKISSLM